MAVLSLDSTLKPILRFVPPKESFIFLSSHRFSFLKFSKMKSKEDPEWERTVGTWINQVIAPEMVDDIGDLYTSLKDGLILCQYVFCWEKNLKNFFDLFCDGWFSLSLFDPSSFFLFFLLFHCFLSFFTFSFFFFSFFRFFKSFFLD